MCRGPRSGRIKNPSYSAVLLHRRHFDWPRQNLRRSGDHHGRPRHARRAGGRRWSTVVAPIEPAPHPAPVAAAQARQNQSRCRQQNRFLHYSPPVRRVAARRKPRIKGRQLYLVPGDVQTQRMPFRVIGRSPVPDMPAAPLPRGDIPCRPPAGRVPACLWRTKRDYSGTCGLARPDAGIRQTRRNPHKLRDSP